MIRALRVLALALICTACGRGAEGADELTVFAAASLRDACLELAEQFEQQGGAPVRYHFAGSNLLARQVVAARGADAFLSADVAQVELLERRGFATPGTRRVLLSNRLVVIVPAGSAWNPERAEDLLRVARLSLGNPELVPAGRYARAWLEAQGVWSALAERVLPAVDVRAALAAVEAGAAQAGICYATDAARSTAVRVAFEVPAEQAPVISYAVCALDGSVGGAEFVEFLASDGAGDVFRQHGFLVPGGEPR